MNAALLVSLLVAAAPQEGDEYAKVRETLEQARNVYVEAVDAARDAVGDDLKRKLDEAKRKGELGSVEELLDQRRAFLNDGALPKAVNTRAYERTLAVELNKLERAYDEAIRDAVRLDRIEEAKQLRDEWAAAQAKPSAVVRAGLADVVVEAGPPRSLECGARFLTDRPYVLFDVPETLPVSRFAPMAENDRGSVTIDVRREGRVYIALADFNPQNKFPQSRKAFESDGWRKTKASFEHSAPEGKSMLIVYYKTFPAGRHVIPRVNYTGPTVLLP